MSTLTQALCAQSNASPVNLRRLALGGLPGMYRRSERLFAFQLRRLDDQVVPVGRSPRYTAIVLIGLASEEQAVVDAVLQGDAATAVCDRLVQGLSQATGVGDLALTLWALSAWGHAKTVWVRERLVERVSTSAALPTVEAAWALAALCQPHRREEELTERDPFAGSVAQRLLEAAVPASGLFPHITHARTGLRRHVACFADEVYPIQALAIYFRLSRDTRALAAARQCAQRLCDVMGPAGQWWWHYDVRTGGVIEPYPVYAVHQDAMAPMALLELSAAGGGDFTACVQRGLDWLAAAPELDGGSLIDEAAGLIWRKVARREPGKLARGLQALSSRIHPHLRAPALDWVLHPRAIDFETRPYHLGWILHAWPAARAAAWPDAPEVLA